MSGRSGKTRNCRRARSSSPAWSAMPPTYWSIQNWWPTASCGLPRWWVARTLSPQPIAVSADAFTRKSLGPSSARWRRARGLRQSNCGLDTCEGPDGIDAPSSLNTPPSATACLLRTESGLLGVPTSYAEDLIEKISLLPTRLIEKIEHALGALHTHWRGDVFELERLLEREIEPLHLGELQRRLRVKFVARPLRQCARNLGHLRIRVNGAVIRIGPVDRAGEHLN